MTYDLKHISGPAVEPVSLAMAKGHLLIEDLTLTTAQTADLESKIRAARVEAETYLGKKIGEQVWDVILDYWPDWNWRIPLVPGRAIDSITYVKRDGTEVIVDPTIYLYSPTRGFLWLKTTEVWPTDELADYSAVRIRLTVGIEPVSNGASPETLRYPDNIVNAILIKLGTLYSLREDTVLGTTMQPGKVGTFESLLLGDRLVTP